MKNMLQTQHYFSGAGRIVTIHNKGPCPDLILKFDAETEVCCSLHAEHVRRPGLDLCQDARVAILPRQERVVNV